MKHRDAPYYADELVRHRHWDDAKKEWSVRTVKFIDYDDAELGWARVSFGARPGDTGLVPQVFRVPVAEIARPMPKEPIFAPPPAPKPSDGTISAPDLAPLRQALRAAQEARATQQEVVDSAADLVARAEHNLDEAQRALRAVTAKEIQRLEALEAQLRNGHDAAAEGDGETVTQSKEHAKAAVETAESVCERFREELRETKAKLSERTAQVGAAASRALVAIFARVAGELAEVERKAALLRAELRAVDTYVTGDLKAASVPNAVAGLLANPAVVLEDPIGYEARAGLFNSRTSRWRDLMQRLVAGDADADFNT